MTCMSIDEQPYRMGRVNPGSVAAGSTDYLVFARLLSTSEGLSAEGVRDLPLLCGPKICPCLLVVHEQRSVHASLKDSFHFDYSEYPQ